MNMRSKIISQTFGALLLLLALVSCKKEEITTLPAPEHSECGCETTVTYIEPHICSGYKFKTNAGEILRVFGMDSEIDGQYNFRAGETYAITYSDYDLEMDCYYLLPVEILGKPVWASCFIPLNITNIPAPEPNPVSTLPAQ